MPQTHPTRTPPSARSGHRSPLQGPQDAAHQILPTHRASAAPDTRPVFQRRARRTRGHLERLPEHHRRLPLIQRAWGKDFNARGNHAPQLHRHALLPHRAHHLGQDTQTPSHRHPGLLRPPTHQQRPYQSHQRTPRTPTRIRTQIPQPHPLHHPTTPRNRRIQTPNNTPNYQEPKLTTKNITAQRFLLHS